MKTELLSPVEELLTSLLYPEKRHQSSHTDKVNNDSSQSLTILFAFIILSSLSLARSLILYACCLLQFFFTFNSSSLFSILVVCSTEEFHHISHLGPDSVPIPSYTWQYITRPGPISVQSVELVWFSKSVKFLLVPTNKKYPYWPILFPPTY